MTTKRITSGWRGFSVAKETAYGTPAAVSTAFNFEGSPTDVQPKEVITNEAEVTGLNEPSAQDILNYMLDNTHAQRAMPHNIAFFLAAVMGKVSTDQPDNILDPAVYRHYIEREVSAVPLPSFTLIENDGVGTKRYPGIYGKTVKLSASREDFVRIEAGFGGMGKEETSAVGKPTVVAESYLRYGDLQFSRGGTLSGSVATQDLTVGGGPTQFKADLRSFEWTLDNQAQAIYEMGDNSGYATRVERGDRFTHDLKAVFEMQGDEHKSGLLAGTEYVLNIPIIGSVIPGGTGSFNFRADIIFPRVVYREAKKDRDGEVMIVNADFQVLEDSTYGSVIIEVHNEQTGYLL